MILGFVISLLATSGQFSIPGIILGTVIGAAIGRLVGRIVKRKLKSSNLKAKNVLEMFYRSYVETISRFSRNLRYDINSCRIILENVIGF